MKRTVGLPSRARGAALVIGLVLLAILTLLAIAGMNTANAELVMAGNEQYRQKAFHAADTGIEVALSKLATIPQTKTPVKQDTTNVDGAVKESFATSSQYEGDDVNVPGFSVGKYLGLHYEITSTGTSARNAMVVNVQGAYVIQNAGGSGIFGSRNP